MNMWTQFNCWRYHTALSASDCIERIRTGKSYFTYFNFQFCDLQNYGYTILNDTQILFVFTGNRFHGRNKHTRYLATFLDQEDGCDIIFEFEGELLGLAPMFPTAGIEAFMKQKLEASEIKEPTQAEQKGIFIFPEVRRKRQAARGIWGLIGLGHYIVFFMLMALVGNFLPYLKIVAMILAMLYPVLMVTMLMIWLSNYGSFRAKYYIEDSVVINRICRKEISFSRQDVTQTALGEKGLAQNYVVLSDRELPPKVLRGSMSRRMKKVWDLGYVVAPKTEDSSLS